MTRMKWVAAGSLVAFAGVVGGLIALTPRPGKAAIVDTARVSQVTGRLAVHGADETAVSYVRQNAVVRNGDTLWTDTGSQGEVELARGAWVRLGPQTKVDLLSVSTNPELRLWSGALYCQVRNEFGRPLAVRTPGGDCHVTPGSILRVEVAANGNTVAKVFLGSDTIDPLNGSRITLAKGQRCSLVNGRLLEQPVAFDPNPQPAALDSFDRYQGTRLAYLNRYREPEALTRPLVGAYELEGRGTWVRHNNRAYWRPYQEAGWRPYSEGYWSYVDDEGLSWVDNEPWGYTTSHYGRWDYLDDNDGWCWEPDDNWAPAHVAWARCDDNYYGWAPLGSEDPYDGWDAPATRLSYWDEDIAGPDRRCWSFAPRDDFYYDRVAYDPDYVYLTADDIFDSGISVSFSQVRDVYRDCGIPRYAVRGFAYDPGGWVARDTVLRVDGGIPDYAYASYGRRFNIDRGRDYAFAQQSSPVEAFQRFRGERFASNDIIRGDAVSREFRSQRRNPEALWGGGGRRGSSFGGRGGRTLAADPQRNVAAFAAAGSQPWRALDRQPGAAGRRMMALANRQGRGRGALLAAMGGKGQFGGRKGGRAAMANGGFASGRGRAGRQALNGATPNTFADRQGRGADGRNNRFAQGGANAFAQRGQNRFGPGAQNGFAQNGRNRFAQSGPNAFRQGRGAGNDHQARANGRFTGANPAAAAGFGRGQNRIANGGRNFGRNRSNRGQADVASALRRNEDRGARANRFAQAGNGSPRNGGSGHRFGMGSAPIPRAQFGQAGDRGGGNRRRLAANRSRGQGRQAERPAFQRQNRVARQEAPRFQPRGNGFRANAGGGRQRALFGGGQPAFTRPQRSFDGGGRQFRGAQRPQAPRVETPRFQGGGNFGRGRRFGGGSEFQPQRQAAPRFQRQEAPRFQRQEAPRFQRQEAPRFQRQEAPRVQRQEAPRYQRQEAPRFQRQEAPRVQRQEAPRFQGGGGGGGRQFRNPGGGAPAGAPAGGPRRTRAEVEAEDADGIATANPVLPS